MNNFKLAVVGNESSVLIFRALGVEVFGVLSDEEALEQIENILEQVQGDEALSPVYATIFVEENFFKKLPADFLEKMSKKSLPAIIPIPSPDSKDKNFAIKRLSKIVERAVGSDIFST